MVARALASTADRVLVDLEDAVAPSRKDVARESVVALLEGLSNDERARISVRINAVGTGWSHRDLVAIGSSPALPQSIVLPKADRRSVIYATQLLDDIDAAVGRGSESRPLGVELLIETHQGLAYVRRAAHTAPRVLSSTIGYADLGASLGRPGPGLPESWLPAQHDVIGASRLWGVAAFDGPHLGVADDEEFRDAVRRSYALGFDGKWVIHPRQIDYVNAAFTPAADQLAWASGVLAALDEAAAAGGRGAVQFEGQMLDEAVALTARRLLNRSGVVR